MAAAAGAADLWLIGLAQPFVVEPGGHPGAIDMSQPDFNSNMLSLAERQALIEALSSGRKTLPLVIDHAGMEGKPGAPVPPDKVIGETVDAFLDAQHHHLWVVARLYQTRAEHAQVLWSMLGGRP